MLHPGLPPHDSGRAGHHDLAWLRRLAADGGVRLARLAALAGVLQVEAGIAQAPHRRALAHVVGVQPRVARRVGDAGGGGRLERRRRRGGGVGATWRRRPQRRRRRRRGGDRRRSNCAPRFAEDRRAAASRRRRRRARRHGDDEEQPGRHAEERAERALHGARGLRGGGAIALEERRLERWRHHGRRHRSGGERCARWRARGVGVGVGKLGSVWEGTHRSTREHSTLVPYWQLRRRARAMLLLLALGVPQRPLAALEADLADFEAVLERGGKGADPEPIYASVDVRICSAIPARAHVRALQVRRRAPDRVAPLLRGDGGEDGVGRRAGDGARALHQAARHQRSA